MHKLLDTVALTHDIPSERLRAGDVGAIVEVYGDDTFEVEFVAASGRTEALVALRANDIRALGDQDLLAVRALSRSAA
jgi:Domain of unknown function (DUF4926)